MPALIRTQTLIDIAKHSDKVIRLSQLMSESEAPYLIGKMAYLDDQSDPFEILQAMESDLNSTIKMLKHLSHISASTDEHGIAHELTANENNLHTIFPKHYQDDALRLFGVSMGKDNRVSKEKNETLKAQVYAHVFKGDVVARYPYEDYKAHLSLLKRIDKAGRPSSDAPFDECLTYAHQRSAIPAWMGFYQAAIGTTGEYLSFRQQLADKERKLVDRKIYAGRAMIDGVAKSSTYIVKGMGLDQLATSHKGNEKLLAKVVALVEKIPYLRSLEIDQDADLLKMHDMLVDVDKMALDIPDAFDMKVRKCGNYRASGIMATRRDADGGFDFMEEYGYTNSTLRIVGADVDAPTSFAHEVAHFRDRDRDALRASMIGHFGGKMDVQALHDMCPKKLDYYFSDREIIARMGEIGMTLINLGHKDGETMAQLLARSPVEVLTEAEEGKQRYNVAISKSLATYMGEGNPFNQIIYFDMPTWSPAEISMLRDYTHDFYFKPDPQIRQALEKRIANGELAMHSKIYQAQKKPNRPRPRRTGDLDAVGKVFGGMNKDDLVRTYQTGVNEGLFTDGDFMEHLSPHATNVFEGKQRKGSIALLNVSAQVKAFSDLGQAIDLEQRPGDALLFERFAMNYAIGSKCIKPVEVKDYLALDARDKAWQHAGDVVNRTLWEKEDGLYPVDPALKRVGKQGASRLPTIYKAPVQADEIRQLALDTYQRFRVERTVGFEPALLAQASPHAQWVGMTELFSQHYAEGSPLTEPNYDLQQEEMTRQSILSLADADPMALTTMLDSAGYTMLMPRGKMLKDMLEQGHDVAVAQALLSDELLKTLAIPPEAIGDFVGEQIGKYGVMETNTPFASMEKGGVVGFKVWLETLATHGAFATDNDRQYFNKTKRSHEVLTDEHLETAPTPLMAVLDFYKKHSDMPESERNACLLKATLAAFEQRASMKVALAGQLQHDVMKFQRTQNPTTHSQVATLNHPWAQALNALLIHNDLTVEFGDGASHKATAILRLLQPRILATTYLEYSMKTPYPEVAMVRINGNVRNDGWQVVPKAYDASRWEVEQNLALATNVQVMVKETMEPIRNMQMSDNPLYRRGKNEHTELNESLNTLITTLNPINPTLTARLMQASGILGSAPFFDDERNLYREPAAQEGLSTLEDQIKRSTLPLLMDKTLFLDLRQTIESYDQTPAMITAIGIAPAVSPEIDITPAVTPEVLLEVTPETRQEVIIEPTEGRVVFPNEVTRMVKEQAKLNREVPAVKEDRLLRSENQMRMF
jgi:hypothetical protein